MIFIRNLFTYILLPAEINDGEKSKLLWLIRLRWLYILFQFLFVIPFLTLNYNSYPKYALYVGLCFMLMAFNAIQSGIVKNLKVKISSFWVLLNLIFDLILFSALYSILVQTIALPMELFFFVHVTLSAVLLTGYRTWIMYVLSAFFLGLFQIKINIMHDEVFLLHSLFFQVILFFVWWISGSLNRYLIAQESILNLLKINSLKRDRLRAVGALAGSFSHEFATPLNTLKLRLDRVSRSIGQTEDIKEAQIALKMCTEIISKINISQLSKEDFIYQEVEVCSLIQEIVKKWNVANDGEKVAISFSRDSEKIKIILPVLNFSQVLLNLLDNSYESKGVKNISIKLKNELSTKKIVLVYEDDGEGFSSEVLAKIGEPFVTSKVNGVGLGLYSIILFFESVGGSVTFNNSAHPAGQFLGKGVRILMNLPTEEC